MKNLIPFLFFLGLLSCSNDDDFTSSRNNIIGQWSVKHSTQEIRADTVYAESGTTFEITFNADGTGTRNTILGIIPFDWYYQFDPEVFILVSKQSGLIFENTQAHNVQKNESLNQIWMYEIRNPNFIADVYKNTWVMTKL